MAVYINKAIIYDRTNPDNVRKGTMVSAQPNPEIRNTNQKVLPVETNESSYGKGYNIRTQAPMPYNVLGYDLTFLMRYDVGYVHTINFNKTGSNRIELKIRDKTPKGYMQWWADYTLTLDVVIYYKNVQFTSGGITAWLTNIEYVIDPVYYFRTTALSLTRRNDGTIDIQYNEINRINWSAGSQTDAWCYYNSKSIVYRYPQYAYLPSDFLEEYISSGDPYEDGGTSEDDPQGGGGDFDNTGEDIPEPSLPQISATDTNFLTLYVPTKSQIQALSNYMWSNEFNLDNFKRLFANPMDAIIGLSIIPTQSGIATSGTKAVNVGNIETPISMNYTDNQFEVVDCGAINLNEFWKGYLDYDPYTKVEIYLPYIGTQRLATDDVMGKTVGVKYYVDILSGACICFVTVDGSVMYSYTGACAVQIPLTSVNYGSMASGVLQSVGGIASVIGGAFSGNPLAVASGIMSTANGVMSSKPTIDKSGSISGNGAIMGVQYPYLIVTRPRQCLPNSQNKYTGYPSYVTKKLSELNGFNVLEVERLTGMTCTENELAELKGLLRTGVIF